MKRGNNKLFVRWADQGVIFNKNEDIIIHDESDDYCRSRLVFESASTKMCFFNVSYCDQWIMASLDYIQEHISDNVIVINLDTLIDEMELKCDDITITFKNR